MALKGLKRKFQRWYQKKIAAEAKGLRELFESLVSLDHGVKRRLGHSVRRVSNLMAAANVWKKDVLMAGIIPTALLPLFVCLVAPFWQRNGCM
jgi:hypothetical protein